jgi:hypothetical protein
MIRFTRFIKRFILLQADSAEQTQVNYQKFQQWFFILSAVCFALALVEVTSGWSGSVFFLQTHNATLIFLGWLIKALFFTYIPVSLGRLERYYIGFGQMTNPVTVDRSFDTHEKINQVIDRYEEGMDKGNLDTDDKLKLGNITRENLKLLRVELSDIPLFKISHHAIDSCLAEITEYEKKLNGFVDIEKMASDAEIRQAVEDSKQAVIFEKDKK